jgi:hypothetical protein
MAFTRNQAKQQNNPQQKNVCPYPPTNLSKNINTIQSHQINFIDSSIEWRKNKIKRDNCTFEYI